MRKPSFTLLLIASVVLGVASVLFANLGLDYTEETARHGLLYVWFFILPVAVDQLFWFESSVVMFTLAVATYTVQYFAVLSLLLQAGRSSGSCETSFSLTGTAPG